MNTLRRKVPASSLNWKQIEVQLLTDVRLAEAAFKQAPDDQKERAGQEYRQALDRFSQLVLDRRFPPGVSLSR